MQLRNALTKLPIVFCAETLAAEVRALPPEAWVPHPRRYAGNEAVPLVTPRGENTDAFLGPMEPTEYLRSCPYIAEVMAELDAVWGRSRLMGLGAGSDVPPHIDVKYYWRTHTRIHVPIVTNPEVRFTCGGETVHMQAGECWALDTFREHTVNNGGAEQRVHLVLDTVGGQRLWDLIDQAERKRDQDNEPETLRPGSGPKRALRFEQHQAPRIMSPWELRCHVDQLLGQAEEHPLLGPVRDRLDRLITGWFGAWAQYTDSDQGLPEYRALLESAQRDLQTIGGGQVLLRNGMGLYRVLEVLLVGNAVPPDQVRKTIDDFEAERQMQAL